MKTLITCLACLLLIPTNCLTIRSIHRQQLRSFSGDRISNSPPPCKFSTTALRLQLTNSTSTTTSRFGGVGSNSQNSDAAATQAINYSEMKAKGASLSAIIKFAIPAVGVWLCSPILSLIDTSAVGLLAGTAQQASLSPAVAVTDYSALMLSFMFTATTNLMAGSQVTESKANEYPEDNCVGIEACNPNPNPNPNAAAAKMLVTSLQLSLLLGTVAGTLILLFSNSLLMRIIGTKSVPVEVFGAAKRYVCVRALGFPAGVVIGSAQAACLGLKDIKSPLVVLATAALVNLLGDFLFVGCRYAWLSGAAGAAWATVFSQYVAMFMFLAYLKNENLGEKDVAVQRRSHPNIRASDKRQNLRLASSRSEGVATLNSRSGNNNSNNSNNDKKSSFNTRGFLRHSKFHKRELLTLPKLSDASKFFPYVIPVTTTLLGRVSAYVTMSHVISATMGPVNMAAQQIMLAIFYTLTPLADSLNLTAQSFIPSAHEDRKGVGGVKFLSALTRKFIQAGLIFGVVLAILGRCTPIIAGCFTNDLAVKSAVKGLAPTLAIVFSVHGVVCAGEGALLAMKDLKFMAMSYTGFFFSVPYFMLRVKKAALAGGKVGGGGPSAVWKVFACYNFVRGFMWVSRIRWLNRKWERQYGGEEGEGGNDFGLPETVEEAGVTPELVKELLLMGTGEGEGEGEGDVVQAEVEELQ